LIFEDFPISFGRLQSLAILRTHEGSMGEPGTARKDLELEEIAATDVRDRLTELMNRASFGGERFALTVHGQRKAALVSVRDLERLRELDLQPAAAQ
jgi:prevent-host-death family protein